jgi:hypothetical protein
MQPTYMIVRSLEPGFNPKLKCSQKPKDTDNQQREILNLDRVSATLHGEVTGDTPRLFASYDNFLAIIGSISLE